MIFSIISLTRKLLLSEWDGEQLSTTTECLVTSLPSCLYVCLSDGSVEVSCSVTCFVPVNVQNSYPELPPEAFLLRRLIWLPDAGPCSHLLLQTVLALPTWGHGGFLWEGNRRGDRASLLVCSRQSYREVAVSYYEQRWLAEWDGADWARRSCLLSIFPPFTASWLILWKTRISLIIILCQ